MNSSLSSYDCHKFNKKINEEFEDGIEETQERIREQSHVLSGTSIIRNAITT